MTKPTRLCKGMGNKFIPNSFQVPNAVVDEIMANLGDTELRCYLLLIRKTTGWHKEMDCISNTQFQRYTGRGKTSITQGLKKLQERGLVFEIETDKGKTNCYALNTDQFRNCAGSESEPVQKVNGGSSKSERVLVQKVNGGSSDFKPAPVQILNTQNTNTKTTIQKTTTAHAPVANPTLPEAEFAMRMDWEPADPTAVNALLHRAGLPDLNDALVLDAALDFVAYWSGKPDVLRTAAEWDMALVKSVVQYCRKYQHAHAPHSAAPAAPAVSKTAQKTAWLRDAGQARLDGKTSGKLKPVIFATICEGLAQMLETGANKGAPMLEGLPHVLATWENHLAGTLAQDAGGERVSAAFAMMFGQSDAFPTVQMLVERLPPLLPQYRAAPPQPSPEQQAQSRARAEKARAELLARIAKPGRSMTW